MAIRYYDEAVVEKIKNWTKNNKSIRILKPDESTRLFEMTAHTSADKPLTLPLIAISRDKDIEILNTQKQSKTFSGYSFKLDNDVSMPINAIPIKLSYQLDVYTRYMKEADEYIRNFVFNLINYPNLKIVLPYNGTNFEHESNILLESSITDNSDIKEHLFADQFTRFTLRFTIDDAYLFSIPENTPAKLDRIDLGVKSEYTDSDIDMNVEIYQIYPDNKIESN